MSSITQFCHTLAPYTFLFLVPATVHEAFAASPRVTVAPGLGFIKLIAPELWTYCSNKKTPSTTEDCHFMAPWTPFFFIQSLHLWGFTTQPRVRVPSGVRVTPRLWVQKTTNSRPPNTAVLKDMPSRTPICQNFASSTFFFLSPARPHEAFAAPPRARVPPSVRVQKTVNYITPSTMQCYNWLLHLVLWLHLVLGFRKLQSPELQGFYSYISHGWYNTKLPHYGLSISFCLAPVSPLWRFSTFA